MITVHHLENSRSQRVLWLLEELEVPYAVKRYDRDKKTMLAPPALKAVHPLGKSEWFAGKELSAADVQMSFPIEAAAARGEAGTARPRLATFLQKIHARPAYERALEKGGPYELLR